MNFAIIENKKVINTIYAEKEYAEKIRAVYYGNLPIEIGDSFVDNKFTTHSGEVYNIPEFHVPEKEHSKKEINEFVEGLMEGYTYGL